MTKCPEPTCKVDVTLTAHLNPRNGKWTILPLEESPGPGDFKVLNSFHEAVDIMENVVGEFPISTREPGSYRTHRPSHFLGGH